MDTCSAHSLLHKSPNSAHMPKIIPSPGSNWVSSRGPDSLERNIFQSTICSNFSRFMGHLKKLNTFNLTWKEDFMNCTFGYFSTSSDNSFLLQDFTSLWKCDYLRFLIGETVQRWKTCFRMERVPWVWETWWAFCGHVTEAMHIWVKIFVECLDLMTWWFIRSSNLM